MKKETIQEWIRNAETHEAIVYHTGHLIEERKDMDLVRKADAFLLAAQEGKIELIIDLLKPCLAKGTYL